MRGPPDGLAARSNCSKWREDKSEDGITIDLYAIPGRGPSPVFLGYNYTNLVLLCLTLQPYINTYSAPSIIRPPTGTLKCGLILQVHGLQIKFQ